MNRTTRQAAAARSRGLDRLRSMTIGTAVAGFAGVAGFGAIAAISNSGVPTVAAANGGADDNGPTDQTTTTTTTRPTRTHAVDGGSHTDADTPSGARHDRRVGLTVEAADWRALGTGVRLLVTDGDLEPARRRGRGVARRRRPRVQPLPT